MRDAICADFFARSIERLLAFANAEYFCIQRLSGTFASHSLRQRGFCQKVGGDMAIVAKGTG